MAQSFGVSTPVPSALGEKFYIGEIVLSVNTKKSEKVVIERLLTNSAIVIFDRTGGSDYEQLTNKTVISYSKLQKIED